LRMLWSKDYPETPGVSGMWHSSPWNAATRW